MNLVTDGSSSATVTLETAASCLSLRRSWLPLTTHDRTGDRYAQARRPSKGFFLPFTVTFRKKTYAAGKTSGGFLPRRPSFLRKKPDSDWIDRPIRPLGSQKVLANEVSALVVSTSKRP